MFYYHYCKETNSSILHLELRIDSFHIFFQCMETENGILKSMSSTDYDKTMNSKMLNLIHSLCLAHQVSDSIMNEIHSVLLSNQL
jgi:hypothetical protein